MSQDRKHLPVESRVLLEVEEPLAAGLYEQRNATLIRRWARGLKRYAESVTNMPAADGLLYPVGAVNLWNLAGAATGFSYTYSLVVNGQMLRHKIETQLPEGRARGIALAAVGDLENMCVNPLSARYGVGGRGYTHSILDYQRLVTDGLPAFGQRIEQGLAAATDQSTCDFYLAASDAYDAVMILLDKAIAACGSGTLYEALHTVSHRPPTSFYEALVLINFMYYVDGCDSIGALDRYLSPFAMDESAEAEALLAAFFANVEENTGWHMILGGEGVDETVTLQCLRAQRTRRPNTGLKLNAETSDAVWDAAFDCLLRGSGSPCFYHDDLYRKGASALVGMPDDDLPHIAYGGCTEFMVEGCSNVGSIDAGVNLLRILEGTIQASLMEADDFAAFLVCFLDDIRRQVEIMATELDLNQQVKAVYRPQLIRTLFIADCLDRAVEYNQGGARYNGGVINVAGIANVANALVAIRAVLDGSLHLDRDQLLTALQDDFCGHEEMRRQLLSLPKFGNRQPDVDELAREVVSFTFREINKRCCYRGNGFLIPSTIMFTTYVGEGLGIDATPDGRRAGDAIADSCGPMQGTDTDGLTSMLASTASLPQEQGLGTMILNLRVSAKLLVLPDMRQKLRGLLTSYFAMGGMQVQVTALDAEVLADAIEHPEAHENLIVRIGGYTEYFNRLSDPLKHEVLKRTEHL